MTLHDDHGLIAAHAGRLIHRLETLQSMTGPMKVAQHQHMQFAERGRALADHLSGIVTLTDAKHYASALALVRVALEHHLIDRLLFLANRWVQEYGVKANKVADEEKRLATLKAGPRDDIARWWYDKTRGRMNVLIRGLFKEGSVGSGTTLSPYYFRLEQYDPFTGRKKLASMLATGFIEREVRQDLAEEQEREWFAAFTYEKLRKNLDANYLLRPRLGVQVDVHHGFLSAFIHPAQRAYESIHGHNIPSNAGGYDHYASELALLYVVAIAAAELEIYGRMSRRRPLLPLPEWLTVEHEVAEARLVTSHFWFLSGEPHLYDRIKELDTRLSWRKQPWKLPRADPMTLPAARIRYYPNPLARLAGLHSSYHEFVTGQVFRSPFERPDARFR